MTSALFTQSKPFFLNSLEIVMNRTTFKFLAYGAFAATTVTLALATSGAAAADVKLSADCVPQLHGMKQKLYDRAGEGTEVLRRFIEIRPVMLDNDVMQTAIWASDVRSARARCLAQRELATASVQPSQSR